MGRIVVASDQTLVDANCLAGDVVNALVYVTGPSVGMLMQVATVDITDKDKMPVLGMIIGKASPTVCTVLMWGIVVPGFALTPNKVYFAGPTGQATTVVPVARPTFVQPIAQALDSARLFLKPSLNYTKLTP